MEAEHSLLDQISRKETELKEQCDLVCKEAETRIHDARVRARGMIEEAEKKGAEDAKRYMDEGFAKLAGEIDLIREAGRKEREEIQKKGTGKIDLAVKWITTKVLG
ncbi:hypothetical protein [Methanospirillum sp.]|uniref:hypothetical protein n=1 Tax=Methanospirillum sp. TaxID=45200 RepID=UPI00298439E2|nr:V-type ATPase subunit subunit G family protein [Methanospirillum sp.]